MASILGFVSVIALIAVVIWDGIIIRNLLRLLDRYGKVCEDYKVMLDEVIEKSIPDLEHKLTTAEDALEKIRSDTNAGAGRLRQYASVAIVELDK